MCCTFFIITNTVTVTVMFLYDPLNYHISLGESNSSREARRYLHCCCSHGMWNYTVILTKIKYKFIYSSFSHGMWNYTVILTKIKYKFIYSSFSELSLDQVTNSRLRI